MMGACRMGSLGILSTKRSWASVIGSALLALLPCSARAITEDALQADPDRSALAFVLKEHSVIVDAVPIDWRRLNGFYRQRDLHLAWIGSASERDLALRALEEAPQEGLSAADYHVGALHDAGRGSPQQIARFDVLL